MSYLDLKLFKPFGPSVAKVTIPENIINELNKYTDQIIKDSDKLKDLNHGKELVGNVQQEFLLDKEFIVLSGWESFLKENAEKWIFESTQKKIEEFRIIDTWIVRQFENEYNPPHLHKGHISGLGYLKLPQSFGNTIQRLKKNNTHGEINFMHGSEQFLSTGIKTEKPKVGDFYVFPSYLYHFVNPFYGDGERRSISFNAVVDESIAKI